MIVWWDANTRRVVDEHVVAAVVLKGLLDGWTFTDHSRASGHTDCFVYWPLDDKDKADYHLMVGGSAIYVGRIVP